MLEPAQAVEGIAVELPAPVDGDPFETNGLWIAVVEDGKLRSKPLAAETWPLRRAERLSGGALRLRHAIDRRKLPDPAHDFWTWKLTAEEQATPFELDSATGPITLPRDALLGCNPGHWIVRDSFRLGRTRFRPQGVFRLLETEGAARVALRTSARLGPRVHLQGGRQGR